jgi:flagellar hook-length control protein FliK
VAAPPAAAPSVIPPKKTGEVTTVAAPLAATTKEQAQATSTPGSIAPPAQQSSAGAAPTAPSPPPAQDTSIPVIVSSRIEHLTATARAVMQTSGRTGISRARIELRPPELGHVEIRLRYSSDGVKATVTASSPAAAQALTSSAGDLKRALEAQGLNVLALDVGHTGSEDGRRPENGAQGQLSQPSAATGDGDEDGDGQAAATTSTVRIPAAGSSVDVLA